MSENARLHVKASIWGKSDNRIAVLMAEGETTAPTEGQNLLVRGALSTGMRYVSNVGRLALPTLTGWSVNLSETRLTSVTFPPGRILLERVPLNLPGAWRWAANRTGRVVLFIGSGLGLPGEVDLDRAAARGDLVGGAVPFHDESGVGPPNVHIPLRAS